MLPKVSDIEETQKQITNKVSIPVIAILMFFSALGGWSFKYAIEQTRNARADLLAYAETRIDSIERNTANRMGDILSVLDELKQDLREMRRSLDRHLDEG